MKKTKKEKSDKSTRSSKHGVIGGSLARAKAFRSEVGVITIIDSEVLTSDIAHCFAFYRFQQFFISSAFGKNKKDAAFSGFDFSQAHEVIVFVASHFLVEAND